MMHELNNYTTIKLKINEDDYDLWVADSDEKKRVGLSNIDHLPERSGMIFTYDKPSSGPFTMRETSIPLTIIFLNDRGETVHQKKCEPYQEELVDPGVPYSYVIEI